MAITLPHLVYLALAGLDMSEGVALIIALGIYGVYALVIVGLGGKVVWQRKTASEIPSQTMKGLNNQMRIHIIPFLGIIMISGCYLDEPYSPNPVLVHKQEPADLSTPISADEASSPTENRVRHEAQDKSAVTFGRPGTPFLPDTLTLTNGKKIPCKIIDSPSEGYRIRTRIGEMFVPAHNVTSADQLTGARLKAARAKHKKHVTPDPAPEFKLVNSNSNETKVPEVTAKMQEEAIHRILGNVVQSLLFNGYPYPEQVKYENGWIGVYFMLSPPVTESFAKPFATNAVQIVYGAVKGTLLAGKHIRVSLRGPAYHPDFITIYGTARYIYIQFLDYANLSWKWGEP